MDDELAELAERLRTATIAHGAPAVFRLLGDYAHGIGEFLDVPPNTRLSHPSGPQPSRHRQNMTHLHSPPSENSDPFSEPESRISTPHSLRSHRSHRSREATSSPHRSTTANHPSRGSVPPSPTPLRTRRTFSPVHTFPATPRTPISPTPPTPTSILTYSSDRLQPVTTPRQIRSQSAEDTQLVVQSGSKPTEAKKVEDSYGLEALAHKVKLQDITLETVRKIHYHNPGERGPKGRWYIVRYGREVGVFNDWNDVNAATSGVSGGNQQSVDNEPTAYTKFIAALEAGEVAIANRAAPFIPVQ